MKWRAASEAMMITAHIEPLCLQYQVFKHSATLADTLPNA
jgi:hypothetical protein